MNARTVLAAALGAATLSACATVEPWERGTLARPEMALDTAPLLSALEAHVDISREAASGGGEAEGGGCGCN